MNTMFSFVKDRLLSGLAITVNRIGGKSETLDSFTQSVTEDAIVCTYSPAAGMESLTLNIKLGEEAILFSVDARLGADSPAFEAEKALELTLGDLVPDALLGSCHDNNPWWMIPDFASGFDAIKPKTQDLLVKSGVLHYHMLPLCGNHFRCEMEAGRLSLTSGTDGLREMSGDFLAVSVSTDPFTAIDNNFVCAHKNGAIRVPLRDERTMPEFFHGFGWCSWDAFYADVTSEKLYAKLDELREKKIPVHWIIIDDGWLSINGDRKLTDFDINRDKFPEGLKATVAKIKGEYGIEKVGVWHAFNGYWMGIDPESRLYSEQKENLFTTPSGIVLPALEEEKAFRFWDAWHSFLADCGVDFVKVDNQSSYSGFIAGCIPTAEGCRIAHRAMDRSVAKNFGGAIINCMGMDMENVLARPMSAVSRNSDDFFPKRERGFVKHLVQNVYNALWHSRMFVCDFDMWWSSHESAVQSGVLRAIAGSPIYVSDKIGESSMDAIRPVVGEDGSVLFCDETARPTLDCIYADCAAEKKLLKVWNRSGDSFAIAAFNPVTEEVTDTLDFGTVPGLSREHEYVAYEYFSKTFTRINAFEDTEITLPGDGVAVWSIYPIVHPDEDTDEGAYILLGDTERYVSIAAKDKKKVRITDIL